jgi:hypothetical protein
MNWFQFDFCAQAAAVLFFGKEHLKCSASIGSNSYKSAATMRSSAAVARGATHYNFSIEMLRIELSHTHERESSKFAMTPVE